MQIFRDLYNEHQYQYWIQIQIHLFLPLLSSGNPFHIVHASFPPSTGTCSLPVYPFFSYLHSLHSSSPHLLFSQAYILVCNPYFLLHSSPQPKRCSNNIHCVFKGQSSFKVNVKWKLLSKNNMTPLAGL